MNLSKRISQPQVITGRGVGLGASSLAWADVHLGVRRWVLFAVEREIADDVGHQLGADLDMRVADHER